MTQQPPFLAIEGLAKTFREGDTVHAVLDGLDLAVGEGEIVAVLGKSGSGKSTLLNLTSGIDRPDAGRIAINGKTLTELSETDRTLFRRRHIGFLFQFFNLIPTLTVWENVTLPVELNGGLDGAATERVRALLARVGLEDRAGAHPERLSGGEQQRVALVRALAHEPALVLADEPTGNLDSETGRRVMAELEALARDEGRTLLLATHSRDVAAGADRTLQLEQGRLQETASASPHDA